MALIDEKTMGQLRERLAESLRFGNGSAAEAAGGRPDQPGGARKNREGPSGLMDTGAGQEMTAFHRHLVEMTLSMVIPWSAFFFVVHLALPSAGLTPAWFFLIPIAIAVMIVPMTAVMLYRRHSGRDIVEMNAAMFVGMLVVMPIARMVLPAMGIQLGFEEIFPIALVAMTGPMVALMYLRREHYTHHAHGRVKRPGYDRAR